MKHYFPQICHLSLSAAIKQLTDEYLEWKDELDAADAKWAQSYMLISNQDQLFVAV